MIARPEPREDAVARARRHAVRRGARVREVAARWSAVRGPSPAPWAWLALGAEGRRELVPPGDQDTALALADPDAPGQEEWARGLAAAVEEDLAAGGVPPCPGGFTARRWCLGLGELCARVRDWLADPAPDAALAAAVFLDARRVAGGLDAAPLRAALAEARERPAFLRALAGAAVAFAVPPPAALLRPGRLDPGRVLAALVLAARALGAAAGARAIGTLERLAAARGAGLVGADLERAAADAFRLLLDERLRAAADAAGRSARAGRPGAPADLRRAVRAVRALQDCAARRFDLR